MKKAMHLCCRVCPALNGILFSALLFLLAGPPVSAQIVTFPDPNLESAVRNALQIPAPTPISQADMLTLTNLPASNNGIQDLTGLGAASNLLTLDISFNQLTNLSPITGLQNLAQLHAGWNPLTDCSPLAALTNLTFLDMNSAQLTNLSPLGGLHNLVQLVVPWNHVLDASPVAGLTNLYWLDIGGNRDASNDSITNITVLGELKHLQWLSLYYLSVTNLSPLAGLTSLTNLDVSWNFNPTNFGALNGLSNLTLLHVTEDNVSNILFVSNLPKLQDLDFGYNNVADLSPVLGRNLTSLMVYYNSPLTNVQLVAGFPQLAHLSVGGDNLTNVSFVSSLTNLQELWLNGDPNVADITPVLGLTNLWHLDVDGDEFTNLADLATLVNLTDLEMNTMVTPPDISFLSQMVNLNSLDLGNDQVGNLTALTNLTQMGNLYLNNDFLTDISPLLFLPNLYYVDLEQNILDTNSPSAAYNVITNLQSNYVNVDYAPQNISPTLIIYDSPADDCIPVGDLAYFACAAGTTSGNGVTCQWQFNGTDLAGQTNNTLMLFGAGTNLAGIYRAILSDGNGFAATTAAHLYVGDTNCGQTVTIVQPPLNTVAAPGESPEFTVVATTTLTNLYYQWIFDGTNLLDETNDLLVLTNVDFPAAGIYQVLVWDDNSNQVISAPAQLKVVDIVEFTDPALSNLVAAALGSPAGAPMHLTDLDSLTQLYADGQNITNLAGLDCARYLNTLDLANNPIGDASALGWDYSLENLYLYNCGLQDASFISSLTNLSSLDLGNNDIHSVPDMQALAANLGSLQLNYDGPLIYSERLACLTNLYNLGVHDDGLADIAFTAGMTQLESLDAGGDYLNDPNLNYISDISPLTGKTLLSWLSLSFNQVTNLPIIAPFTGLYDLYLSSNHFGNISFITNLPNLQQLSVNDSTVTNLAALTNHTMLTYLDVSYTAASDLSPVSGLINLNTLYAGGNHVGTAAFVASLVNLNLLGLDTDDLTNLSPLTALGQLTYLDLENNFLTNATALAPKTSLVNLYLSGNQIHDLTPLSGLVGLQWLSLNANGLTNVSPLASLTGLQWLVLQSNSVQDVTALAGLTNLQYDLDLSVNLLTNVAPLTNLHKLGYVSLWQNRLTTLPSLVGLSNVTSLDFHANQLTNATGISGMTLLTWLSLNQNDFTTAPTLTGLPNLNSLDLGNNQLTDVSPLAGLTTLNWLYLGNNDLGVIHPLTGLTKLYYVDLTYNWLDTNATSAAMADIGVMQGQGTYVNYVPQNSLLLSAPVMSAPKHFQFTIYSPVDDVLQISRSSDLSSWTSLGTFTNTGGTNVFIDTNATGANFFYRAQP
jgi:internalin A